MVNFLLALKRLAKLVELSKVVGWDLDSSIPIMMEKVYLRLVQQSMAAGLLVKLVIRIIRQIYSFSC